MPYLSPDATVHTGEHGCHHDLTIQVPEVRSLLNRASAAEFASTTIRFKDGRVVCLWRYSFNLGMSYQKHIFFVGVESPLATITPDEALDGQLRVIMDRIFDGEESSVEMMRMKSHFTNCIMEENQLLTWSDLASPGDFSR